MFKIKYFLHVRGPIFSLYHIFYASASKSRGHIGLQGSVFLSVYLSVQNLTRKLNISLLLQNYPKIGLLQGHGVSQIHLVFNDFFLQDDFHTPTKLMFSGYTEISPSVQQCVHLCIRQCTKNTSNFVSQTATVLLRFF